jgi:hypothetical protein
MLASALLTRSHRCCVATASLGKKVSSPACIAAAGAFTIAEQEATRAQQLALNSSRRAAAEKKDLPAQQAAVLKAQKAVAALSEALSSQKKLCANSKIAHKVASECSAAHAAAANADLNQRKACGTSSSADWIRQFKVGQNEMHICNREWAEITKTQVCQLKKTLITARAKLGKAREMARSSERHLDALQLKERAMCTSERANRAEVVLGGLADRWLTELS